MFTFMDLCHSYFQYCTQASRSTWLHLQESDYLKRAVILQSCPQSDLKDNIQYLQKQTTTPQKKRFETQQDSLLYAPLIFPIRACLSSAARSRLKFVPKVFSLRFVAGWQWIERFWGDLWVCGVLRDRLQTLVRKRRGKAALLRARSHLWSNRSELNLWVCLGNFKGKKLWVTPGLSSLMLVRWMKAGSIGYRPSHTPTLTEAFQVLIRIIV